MNKRSSPYELGDKVKSLGMTELAVLRGFVRDVLRVCELDDTETCMDLYDPALQAAEILGIVVPRYDEDPVDEQEDLYHRRDQNNGEE